ncbi:adhesion G protein-coupled receptor G3 isoform X2 [Rattus norvegicus]|uniref:Adhesion G protein-coupled receptor G3 n=2 Tax=Rattus norvegicus TaxID=10116 RepID=A0A0G2JSN6_RAT|nr:adhesion G protein-coupled receptor G3 isoform X2 [Rattus norvegicus]|eukprot:XP_006255188.1 PREDICTED: adhesion G protein-coupled receptor G3 isoform X1 [Rattus norvegicus]
MATARSLGLLLFLLLTSDENNGEEPRNPEEPRNVCRLKEDYEYNTFDLSDIAQCFTKCGQSDTNSCEVGNLQRYWLNYESHLLENSMETVDMPFVKALIQNISTDVSEDLLYSLVPSQIPRQVMRGEDQPADRVRLPKSLFGALPGNRSAVRLAITILNIGPGNVFKGPRLLEDKGSSVLNNRMVGLSVGQMHATGLSEPVEITFSHQHQSPNVILTCVFWDMAKGDWDSHGCSTEPGDGRTVCRCDHLTFFALLLRPTLDQATARTLTRISQAGSAVSMIFLAFTMVLYVAFRFSLQRFKSEDAPKIHMALSTSLFLLNLTFLINVGSGSQGPPASCWVRAAIFHYFLLCVFTWMGLEAFHLYLLVIKVFNTYFGHYFLKLSLLGWGLPVLIVIGVGSSNSYGVYTIRDQENRTSLELCWFQKEPALYATVHGYFLVTFLFGAVVLAMVAWKIFTLPSVTAGKGQGQTWKSVLTVLGLSSLVGMTWGLAVLTPLGLSTVYIFTLLNSLQGLFIFCWFIILYFPTQSTTTSSSGTARLDQAHSMSQE